MKNFYIGFIIGVTSLIPGISAGTIIYISNEYNYITSLINNFNNNIKNIIFLFTGILLGVLSFSKIIEYLFTNYYFLTMFIIIVLLLYNFIKLLPKYYKLNLFYILIGILIIYIISIFKLENEVIITNYPKITISFLLLFSFFGFLDGLFTITPGISGSMVMMILGPYYLYKSYLANINIKFIIPLLVYFIGDILGIVIGSKLSTYFLKYKPTIFNNIIIGMVASSIIFLIPDFYNSINILSILLTLIFILFIERKKQY